MRRLLIVSALMIGALWIGWRYAPDYIHEKLLGFVGSANFGSVSNILRNAVIREDPVVRRQSAIDALKEKVGAIRRQTEAIESFGISESDATFLEGIGKTAGEAAEIITQFEEANNEQSLGGRVAARVIDAILPAPSGAQCADIK